MDLVQDHVQCRALVLAVLNLKVLLPELVETRIKTENNISK
jgi:hypothetical protein